MDTQGGGPPIGGQYEKQWRKKLYFGCFALDTVLQLVSFVIDSLIDTFSHCDSCLGIFWGIENCLGPIQLYNRDSLQMASPIVNQLPMVGFFVGHSFLIKITGEIETEIGYYWIIINNKVILRTEYK